MNSDYIKRLQRKLARCKAQVAEMEKLHSGNEQSYTYHGGFSLGYLRAQVSEIEDFLYHVDNTVSNE